MEIAADDYDTIIDDKVGCRYIYCGVKTWPGPGHLLWIVDKRSTHKSFITSDET